MTIPAPVAQPDITPPVFPPEKPCPARAGRNLPPPPMGQQTNKIEKKKRRLAYLERKKERVKKAIAVAKKASRK